MSHRLNFKQKSLAVLSVVVMLVVLVSVVSIYSLRAARVDKDSLAFGHAQDLIAAEHVRALIHQEESNATAYLLTRDGLFLADVLLTRSLSEKAIQDLKTHSENPTERSILNKLEGSWLHHRHAIRHAIQMRIHRAGAARVGNYFNRNIAPRFDILETTINSYVALKREQLTQARLASESASDKVMSLLLVVASIAVFFSLYIILAMSERFSAVVRARDDILAVVSHDLKNPLTAILMDPKLTGPVRRSAQRIGKMIQDLLDVTKFESGLLSLEISQQPVATLVDEALEMLEPMAKQKAIRLVKNIDDRTLYAACDSQRAAQVFWNLIGNAIKFTPNGGTISINAEPNGADILFEVRDTGPGISQEHLPHIFQRFWQARRSSRGSAGLGLAIAKAFVDAHGGKIWAENAQGGGTSFFFTLPVRPNLRAVVASARI